MNTLTYIECWRWRNEYIYEHMYILKIKNYIELASDYNMKKIDLTVYLNIHSRVHSPSHPFMYTYIHIGERIGSHPHLAHAGIIHVCTKENQFIWGRCAMPSSCFFVSGRITISESFKERTKFEFAKTFMKHNVDLRFLA